MIAFARIVARVGRVGSLAGAAVIVIGASGAALSSMEASAQGPSAALGSTNYNLSAEADSVQMVAADSTLPLGLTVAASPWGASAALNNIGLSTAAAGAPYSPAVASLPGLVNGLGSGFLPPVPPLPGYVSSTYPSTPRTAGTQGPLALSAISSPDSSVGRVAVSATGATPNVFASASATANPDGSLTASGNSGVDLLNFSGLFDIGQVSSNETMTVSSSGKVTVTGGTKLGTVDLLNIPTGIDGVGLKLLGHNIQLPLTATLLPILNKVLGTQGISLAYLPEKFEYTDGTSSTGATPTTGKIVQAADSGALQVTLLRSDIPTQGPLTVTITLGAVDLGATSTALPSVPATPPVTSAVPTQPGAGTPSTPTSSAAAVSGAESTPTGSASNSPTPASPAANTITRTNVALPPAITRAARTGPSTESFYLILVLAGLAALGGSQLIRFVSVRLAFDRP